MKFPEKTKVSVNINIIQSDATLIGCILLISHILGYLQGWGWPILYIPILIMGYFKENKNDCSDD